MAKKINGPASFTKILFWTIFLSSGAFGLIYEILWVRFFSLAIGSTIYAASAVTAAYMGGLAIGAWMPGRYSDAVASPLKWYAAFEFLIGLYAVGFLYASSYIDAFASGLDGITAKFVLTMVSIIIPTALMGATLPFISTAYVRIFAPANRDFAVSFLYGVNALGGVAGIVLSSFYLIYVYGVSTTTFIAASGNFLIAVLALVIHFNAVENSPEGAAAVQEGRARMPLEKTETKNLEITGFQKWACFIAFFFTGFCALALEIVWTRLLVLIIGTSIYAFSIILIAYICGIPAGSILIPMILKRAPRMEAFGVVMMMLAAASLLTLPMISAAPFIFLRIYSAYHGDFSAFLFVEYLLCLVVMLLPATLSGYAFTCALGSIRTSVNTIGGDVGRLYFFNTIGSVLGSILAPFFFIKNFGLQNSVIILSSIFLIAGAALTMMTRAGATIKFIRVGACSAVFILILLTGGTLDMDIIASGMHYHPEKMEDMKSVAEIKRYIKLGKKMFLAEGVDSTVGIYTKNDVSFLKINGKIDASTGWYDMNTQLLLAHIPMVLCKHPDRVSVIGLGAGVTAGAVMKHGPRQVDCIEINPNVIEAARYFKKVSGLDFSAPNLSIIEDDALSFMKNTRNKYNVIISEPSNPWMAGVASLFTIDHFQNCRARLEDGGIICQWLQIYSMSHDDFVRILVTFHKVFPNATLWFSSWGDALIIASKDKFDIDFNAVRARVAKDGVREQLGVVEVFSADAFLAHQILDSETLSALSLKYTDTDVNSHERPYLEFSAPANYYRQDFETITGALLALQKPEKLILADYFNQFPPDDSSYETLARAYYKLKQITRARDCFKKATDKNPALWFIHLKKAENLYAEGLLIESINEVQIAIFLAPDKKECYAALLKVAIRMKDYYAIVRVFSEAEKYFTGPDRHEYHLAMATGYDGCGESASAVSHYKKALELAENNFIANKNLGLLLLKSDDPKASLYLEKAYKINQKDIEVIEALSKIHGGK